MQSNQIDIKMIDAFVFDFDGVLTNNLVNVDQYGNESVVCSRADGLAFDLLRNLNKPSFILSTEKNLVVESRAKKLQLSVIQGVSNKYESIKVLADKENINLNKMLYVGNDLNDYHAMKICGFCACPSDSHSKIKEISNFVLDTEGGMGVVRELLEEVFRLDMLELLYK